MKKIKLIQGAAFVWFVFILFIIVFGFTYSILMKPVGIMYNHDYNDSLLVSEDVYQNFYTRSKAIFFWFPLVAILAMVYWAIIRMHQRNEYGGEGG